MLQIHSISAFLIFVAVAVQRVLLTWLCSRTGRLVGKPQGKNAHAKLKFTNQACESLNYTTNIQTTYLYFFTLLQLIQENPQNHYSDHAAQRPPHHLLKIKRLFVSYVSIRAIITKDLKCIETVRYNVVLLHFLFFFRFLSFNQQTEST